MDNNMAIRPKDKGFKHHNINEDALSKVVRHPKILVVEDDVSYEPLWRKVFQEIDPEIEYAWCTNASEAQKILEKTLRDGEYWDLVIADIFLSGSRTGLDLWERCGEPVENMIIVSSVEYSKLLDYIGPAATPPVYLRKPLNLKECISAVSEFVGEE
jgi:response regulator of citrate/malate metabolism